MSEKIDVDAVLAWCDGVSWIGPPQKENAATLIRVLRAEVEAARNPDLDAEPVDPSDAAMRYAEDQRAAAWSQLSQARAATDATMKGAGK